jgi:hypothetical protein
MLNVSVRRRFTDCASRSSKKIVSHGRYWGEDSDALFVFRSTHYLGEDGDALCLSWRQNFFTLSYLLAENLRVVLAHDRDKPQTPLLDSNH